MKRYLSFSFVFFLAWHCWVVESKEIVTLAALAPITGEWDVGRTTAAAIPIAVEDINNDTSLLPNHDLQFVFGNTNCSSLTALPIVMNFWAAQKRNVDAFIGGGCNHVCEYISLLAGKWNLPVVSWGCMSGHLSNRITFPTFARTVGPYTKMEKLLKRLMEHFHWKRVAIIASTDDIWQIAANLVKIEFAKDKAGITVAHFHSFIPGRLHVLESRIDRQADQIKLAAKRAKIFILLCSGGDIRDIMLNFLDLGLLNGKNAFITVHLPKRSYIGNNTWMGNDGRDDDAKKAYEGVLNIEQKFGTAKTSGDKVQTFLDRVRLRLKEEPFNIELQDNSKIEAYAGTMYDAVYLYAIALNETLSEGGTKRDGLRIARKMYNRIFEGVAGTVYIDNKGDRDPDYTIQTLINDKFEDIAYYTRYNDNFTIQQGVTIIWPGGVLTPPKDSPECGWKEELCEETGDSTTYVIIASCTISGVLFVTLVFVFVYRKLAFELDLAQNQSWKVKEEDIIFRENPYGPSLRSLQNSQAKSIKSFKSIHSAKEGSMSHVSIKSAKSTDTQSSARWSLHEPVFSSVFTGIALYKAEMVAVKRMKKKEIPISRKILIEVKQVGKTFVRKIRNLFQTTNSVEYRQRPGKLRKLSAQEILLLKNIIATYPEIYEDELQDWLEYLTGQRPSLSAIQRCLQRMGWTRKKLNLVAKQRNERLRAEFRHRIAQFETHQLLFIDESSKDDRTFQRRYARSLRGTRISVKGNFTRGSRYSVLSALNVQGVVASHTVVGSYDQKQYEFAVTNFILPFVGSCARKEPSSVVIMDNCTIHNSDIVIEAVRRRGGIVLFLPPYSPDMNPIEEAFGCSKSWLQKHPDVCTKYPKWCFEMALEKITPHQSTGFFKDSGYF